MGTKPPLLVLRHVKRHHDFMWYYLRDLVLALLRPAMIFLIFFGIAVILLFAAAFYYVEGHGVNPNVNSFFDAIYFAVTTMTTVGFVDINPVTRNGRAVAILMMLIGTGLFVSFTAVISSSILAIESERTAGKKP